MSPLLHRSAAADNVAPHELAAARASFAAFSGDCAHPLRSNTAAVVTHTCRIVRGKCKLHARGLDGGLWVVGLVKGGLWIVGGGGRSTAGVDNLIRTGSEFVQALKMDASGNRNPRSSGVSTTSSFARDSSTARP